jgi:hypothetical protein
MNPIISSPGAEYICPSCGKKSRLPLNVAKYGLFKVACFYCKYISEIQFEISENQNPEVSEVEDDQLNPLYDLPDPFSDDSEKVSENEIEYKVAPEPGNVEDSVDNPVDHPMDLSSFQSSDYQEQDTDKAPLDNESVSKEETSETPTENTENLQPADFQNSLVPYKKLEFSSKFVGKVADVLDIEKISVPEEEYVPIFEVKKKIDTEGNV